MSADITKVDFITSENYLKRSSFCGHQTLTLGAYGTANITTIDHNLGYVPLFDVYCEFDAAGEIIAGGEKVNAYTESANLSGLAVDPPYPFLRAWATTTQLIMRLENNTSPLATGTRELYWLIYLDYSNA
jgi:hypothetical protein